MRRSVSKLLLLALALGFSSGPGRAEQPVVWPAVVEVGATGMALADTTGSADAIGAVAVDFAAGWGVGPGEVSLVLEADTRPWFVDEEPWFEAEKMAFAAGHGTPAAWNQASEAGRVTEFRYRFGTAAGRWSVGILETKAYVDTSAVANDDKTQFVSPEFVNNPTLAMPGSSLGISWQRDPVPGHPGFTAVLAEGADSGVFMALETARLVGSSVVRLGVWQGPSVFTYGEAGSPIGRANGLYAVVDGQLARLSWNLRAGASRTRGQASQAFLGLAAEWPWSAGRLGAALGYSRSDAGGEIGASGHAELFYRRSFSGGLVVTPCIRFYNGGASGTVAGVRFRWLI